MLNESERTCKISDLLKAVGFNENDPLPSRVRARLRFDVMVQENKNVFLIHDLSVQSIARGDDRLIIHVENRPHDDK